MTPDTVRLSIPILLAIVALVLGGCAGLQPGSESAGVRAVTGGYRGDETLAVLLPESGRFAGAAEVVRNGIVSAHEADPQGKRPTVRFYDSSSGSATALVDQAAADGASLVIGPLQKPAVDKLAAAGTLPVPVLALNLASSGRQAPANLFQFSLAPEDEAVTVARQAWKRGYRSALMLFPEGAWGTRISLAFRQEWKVLGGTLVASRVFAPNATDFSRQVADLADRASEADFLFLVATSDMARSIWPVIQQRIGTDLPVVSTSHIYSGRFDPQDDRDLVGLSFVEIPWLVEPAGGDAVSLRGLSQDLPRLYAMGVDAYRLGSRLERMAANPRFRVQGKTGILAMDSRRRIERELTLARFETAGPVRLVAGVDRDGRSFLGSPVLDDLGPAVAALGSAGLGASR